MHIVVLGVDSPIGLALVRDLGRQSYKVIGIGGNPNSIGLSSRYCSIPMLRQQDAKKLIKQLIEIAEIYKPIGLMTVSESDINLLNNYREELSVYYNLLFPNADMMAIALDKSITAQYALPIGIEVPKSWRIESLAELENLRDEFVFPVVLKWANPHENAAALKAASIPINKLEYCHDFRMLSAALIRYESINKYPLIQQYYGGHGLGQFFLCHGGQTLMQFQHERINEWPPEGGTSTLCKSVSLDQHQDCLERSKQLLKSIGWTGVAMVEYRYNPASQEYVLMEINGRFWGSTPLALVSGVNFASSLVQVLALNKDITQPKIKNRYCRFMIPEFRRLHRLIFNESAIKDPYFKYNKLKELLKFFAFFINPKCRYYVLSIDDPKPLIMDLKHIITKFINR